MKIPWYQNLPPEEGGGTLFSDIARRFVVLPAWLIVIILVSVTVLFLALSISL